MDSYKIRNTLDIWMKEQAYEGEMVLGVAWCMCLCTHLYMYLYMHIHKNMHTSVYIIKYLVGTINKVLANENKIPQLSQSQT